jgi:hypothetical protein
MGQIIYNAVDWMSIKLCGISTPFLFISGAKVTTYLGVVVMLSTLLYNGIRIYKEIKNKK